MDLIGRKLFRKVDDYNGVKGAFLYADSAARAEVLGDECLVVLRPLDNTRAAGLVHWTVDDALQPAFLWLAELLVKYRYSVRIICFRIAQLHVIFAIMHYIDMPRSYGS